MSDQFRVPNTGVSFGGWRVNLDSGSIVKALWTTSAICTSVGSAFLGFDKATSQPTPGNSSGLLTEQKLSFVEFCLLGVGLGTGVAALVVHSLQAKNTTQHAAIPIIDYGGAGVSEGLLDDHTSDSITILDPTYIKPTQKASHSSNTGKANYGRAQQISSLSKDTDADDGDPTDASSGEELISMKYPIRYNSTSTNNNSAINSNGNLTSPGQSSNTSSRNDRLRSLLDEILKIEGAGDLFKQDEEMSERFTQLSDGVTLYEQLKSPIHPVDELIKELNKFAEEVKEKVKNTAKLLNNDSTSTSTSDIDVSEAKRLLNKIITIPGLVDILKSDDNFCATYNNLFRLEELYETGNQIDLPKLIADIKGFAEILKRRCEENSELTAQLQSIIDTGSGANSNEPVAEEKKDEVAKSVDSEVENKDNAEESTMDWDLFQASQLALDNKDSQEAKSDDGNQNTNNAISIPTIPSAEMINNSEEENNNAENNNVESNGSGEGESVKTTESNVVSPGQKFRGQPQVATESSPNLSNFGIESQNLDNNMSDNHS